MAAFNYLAEAELFLARSGSVRGRPIEYKRFKQAADAVRFAIEKVRPERLRAACLEVDDIRYDHVEIRRLYDSSDYPAPRGDAGGRGGPRTRVVRSRKGALRAKHAAPIDPAEKKVHSHDGPTGQS